MTYQSLTMPSSLTTLDYRPGHGSPAPEEREAEAKGELERARCSNLKRLEASANAHFPYQVAAPPAPFSQPLQNTRLSQEGDSGTRSAPQPIGRPSSRGAVNTLKMAYCLKQ